MTILKNRHWNEKIVMAHLEEAAAIHRRLPEVKVAGYRCLWPETLRDDWERLYDAVNGANRLGPPMPPEVTYQESVMEWLRWLSPHHQRVVWMRANRIPWKILSDEFDRNKTTLWRDMNKGLTRISTMLCATEHTL